VAESLAEPVTIADVYGAAVFKYDCFSDAAKAVKQLNTEYDGAGLEDKQQILSEMEYAIWEAQILLELENPKEAE